MMSMMSSRPTTASATSAPSSRPVTFVPSSRPVWTAMPSAKPGSADPPMWILGLASAAQTVACVLLVMYLMGRLQCDKYVYSVLWLTTLWWSVGMAWYLGSGKA